MLKQSVRIASYWKREASAEIENAERHTMRSDFGSAQRCYDRATLALARMGAALASTGSPSTCVDRLASA